MKLRTRRPSDEIPTSSTADIAFLLVIYFMLTVTFSASKGLDFALPEDQDTDVIEPLEAVLVEVLPGGDLRVDGRPMVLGELLGYLAPKLAVNPGKPVILRPLPDATYGSMVAVYDLLRQGREALGLERDIQIALPTEREMAEFWL